MTVDDVCYAVPTCDDHKGLWGTLAALRSHTAERGVPVVVVDNNPDGPQADANKNACDEFAAAYVVEPVSGNARAKQKCVESAPRPYVCVIDSHVVLAPDFTAKIVAAYATLPEELQAATIMHGPLRMGDAYATHMDDVWRGTAWGTWGDDSVRRLAPGGVPFEIGAQGMGVFVVNRAFFLAHAPFAPDLIGFTGEEWYTHTKYRRAGGRAYCAPALEWVHRFHQPYMQLGPAFAGDVLRANYVRQHQELGLDMNRILPTVALDWTGYVKPGARVLLDERVGVWDRVFQLQPGDMGGCSLQVSADAGGVGGLFDAAVRYAKRPPEAYAPEGGYDFVLTDGGSTHAVAAQYAPARVACAIDGYADASPPADYWTYRKDNGLIVYTCDPADAEPGLPSKLRMLRNLVGTLARTGLTQAPPELAAARAAVCESNGGACPAGKRRLSDNRCSDCGCALEYKQTLLHATCPLGYW